MASPLPPVGVWSVRPMSVGSSSRNYSVKGVLKMGWTDHDDRLFELMEEYDFETAYEMRVDEMFGDH